MVAFSEQRSLDEIGAVRHLLGYELLALLQRPAAELDNGNSFSGNMLNTHTIPPLCNVVCAEGRTALLPSLRPFFFDITVS